MKQFYILISFLFSLCSYSQDCNIGNELATNDFTNIGETAANLIVGVKYTLHKKGTLNSINLIGNNTGNGVQMAVYDDNDGVPNSLIATSNLGTIGKGVTSLPVTSTLLLAGDYWVMAVYEVTENQTNANPKATGNHVYYQDLNFGDAFPNNASNFSLTTGLDFLFFLEIDCFSKLSTDNNIEQMISIFPNPATDLITINNLKIPVDYFVINKLGQYIQKGTVKTNKNKIDIRNLSKGSYFLKFEDRSIIKFVKE